MLLGLQHSLFALSSLFRWQILRQLVACSAARVFEGLSSLRDKIPIVAGGVKGQFEDSKRIPAPIKLGEWKRRWIGHRAILTEDRTVGAGGTVSTRHLQDGILAHFHLMLLPPGNSALLDPAFDEGRLLTLGKLRREYAANIKIA